MDILTALQVYRDLADWYERQGQPAMRDRFLILAAEAAFSAGKPDEAERLRQRLLQGNPHHMLKPFSSFSQALQSTNIQIYIHDLQVNYPPETAESLLQDLRGGSGPTGPGPEANIPQTAPLINIPDEPTLPLGGPSDSLKVYPLRDEPDATIPASPPVKPTNLERHAPRKPPTGSPPAAPNRRSSLNTPAPPAHPALPRAPARPASVPALAVYTLARPFLPPQWLP
jgi:hypothetical protein